MPKVHVHIHKVGDDASERAALKQAKQHLEQAKKLLGPVADEAENAQEQRAASLAWDDVVSAIRNLTAF